MIKEGIENMDDGAAGSIIWFVILLLLQMLLNGFDSSFRNRKSVEKEETEGEESGRSVFLFDHRK